MKGTVWILLWSSGRRRKGREFLLNTSQGLHGQWLWRLQVGHGCRGRHFQLSTEDYHEWWERERLPDWKLLLVREDFEPGREIRIDEKKGILSNKSV